MEGAQPLRLALILVRESGRERLPVRLDHDLCIRWGGARSAGPDTLTTSADYGSRSRRLGMQTPEWMLQEATPFEGTAPGPILRMV